ncbi:hypothetical protein Lal_00046515 [Lupinus albus]|nr:hypothetical protein Lal_00046515 [Lupinus albus]
MGLGGPMTRAKAKKARGTLGQLILSINTSIGPRTLTKAIRRIKVSMGVDSSLTNLAMRELIIYGRGKTCLIKKTHYYHVDEPSHIWSTIKPCLIRLPKAE